MPNNDDRPYLPYKVPVRKRSPYRDLAQLRQQMHDEVASLREEVLSNSVTIEELKKRLEKDEA